jgi:hypothetical protein
MTEGTERWLPVPIEGFEDLYEVSDLGSVRSLDRMVWSKGRRSRVLRHGRVLIPDASSAYLRVTMVNGDRKITVLVHRLVLGAFVGPCPPGQEARHGTGGRRDNSIRNLSWGTKSQNNGEDKHRDNTTPYGERSGAARLSREIVCECRVRYSTGESSGSLAKEFGVSLSAMSNAIIGRTWSRVTDPPPADELRGPARLTQAEVALMRERHAEGASQRVLAAEFGMGKAQVSKIVTGQSWRKIGHTG